MSETSLESLFQQIHLKWMMDAAFPPYESAPQARLTEWTPVFKMFEARGRTLDGRRIYQVVFGSTDRDGLFSTIVEAHYFRTTFGSPGSIERDAQELERIGRLGQDAAFIRAPSHDWSGPTTHGWNQAVYSLRDLAELVRRAEAFLDEEGWELDENERLRAKPTRKRGRAPYFDRKLAWKLFDLLVEDFQACYPEEYRRTDRSETLMEHVQSLLSPFFEVTIDDVKSAVQYYEDQAQAQISEGEEQEH